jgi:hypothetical protein
MSTQTVPSIESFLAAIAAAEQRLADGEAKARQAKALLLQVEKARDEASARKAAAEQQLAAVEAAVKKARALRALLGDDLVSQGEALLEQSWAEAQAELTRLQAEATEAQAEVERLLATPEAQAYLDYRKAQEEARQEEQTRARQELEARLIALRPGAAVGQGAEALTTLAAEADKAGFPDLAAQVRDAAEGAQRVAQAQAQAAAALRKRRLIRWADGRTSQAQPGDFVFVLQDGGDSDPDPDGDTDIAGAAVHLHPLPAHSGRLRFQVVAAHNAGSVPPEYGDVPARGRVWRWKNPPAGEHDGLNEAQAQVVAEIVRGKLRCGWAINRANARLARQAAQERATTREAQHTDEQAAVAPVASSAAIEIPAPFTPSAPGAGDLDGLPPQVAARLRRVGLNTRQAVEQMLADEVAFLSLPGIGQATLAAVQAWLNTPAQADLVEAEAKEQPQSDLTDTEVEAEVGAESPVTSLIEERSVTIETNAVAPAVAGLVALAAAFEAPLAANAVCKDAPTQYQPQPVTPEPIITVEGDAVDGQRLAQWQGVARVGLTPIAQRLGLEEVQVLVHENEGQSTLVAYWPGGETTLSCPVDGRAGQMRAVRELVQLIQAAV